MGRAIQSLVEKMQSVEEVQREISCLSSDELESRLVRCHGSY